MKRTLATLSIAVLLSASTATGCTVIEDGEVGVVMRFGEIADEPLMPGFTFRFPVVRSIEKWNVKLEELKETASVPSSEGMVVGLDASLLYRVKPELAPRIRKTVGVGYRETLIVPLFRSEIRKVAAGQPVRDMYSEEGREQMSQSVMANLRSSIGAEGVEIVNVLLRDVKLPQRFKEAIEAKLTAEQKVQQKQFELQQAEKDAEIEIARARGAAESQKIVRSTLSDSYLHYLWIKTLNENPDVIYVATEANLPIFKSVK
jgi:prohibitin 1